MLDHVQSCLFMFIPDAAFEDCSMSLVLLSWLLMKNDKKAYFTLHTIAARMKGFPEIRLQHQQGLAFFQSENSEFFFRLGFDFNVEA